MTWILQQFHQKRSDTSEMKVIIKYDNWFFSLKTTKISEPEEKEKKGKPKEKNLRRLFRIH